MSDYEETVDNLVAEIADKVFMYAKSIRPNIGFKDIDMVYSLCLVAAALSEDESATHAILDECFAVVDAV